MGVVGPHDRRHAGHDGSRSSRSAARYEADRALFLMLLSAPYHSRLSERMIQANQQARARRSLPPKL